MPHRLDPAATGLMIFAIGESTKLISYLEKTKKTYEAEICLGAVSDTYDADGEIMKAKDPRIPSNKEMEKVIKTKFTGEIMQAPPAYSAIQIDGKRAYELARKNKKLNMAKRPVNVYEIGILSYDWPLLKLRIFCGSGTYIRSIAHDLGQELKCGGYVKELRRFSIGDFSLANAKKIDEAGIADVMAPQEMLKDAFIVELENAEYELLSKGGFIDHKSVSAAGNKVPILAIYKSKCVGALEIREGKFKFAKKFNL